MSGPLRRAESGVFAHNVHVEALPSGMDTITLSALESPVAKHLVARSCSFFVTPNDPSVNSRRAAVHSLHRRPPPTEKRCHGRAINRPVAFAFLVALLCLLPCTLLFISIDSGDSLLRSHLLRIPVVFWAGWAVLSIWAALDMPRISKIFGRSTDPLGPEAMGLCVLALSNCASVLAFLFMKSTI